MAIYAEFPYVKPNFMYEVTLDPDSYGVTIQRLSNTDLSLTMTDYARLGITFKYQGRSPEDFELISNFYATCKGTWLPFTLPNTMWTHGPDYRAAILEVTKTTLFRFREPIRVVTVYRGIYSFDVSIQSVVGQPYSGSPTSFPNPVPGAP